MEDGGFRKLIRSMNRSLPRRRMTLEVLMSESHPSIRGRDGTVHDLDPKELETISALVPQYEWTRLLMPIIIEMTPDFGATSARIRGRVECSLVIKLLELKKTADDLIILYLLEIRALRRVLPTTTQYGFFISRQQ